MLPQPPIPVPPATTRAARDTDARAVVGLLQTDHHLEVAFEPREFVVAEIDGKVVACARLKPLSATEAEIASVVVDPSRRGSGLGALVVAAALRRAPRTVYALALAPGFFEAQGFRPIPVVPDALVGKATSVCASSGFVPMALVRA